MARIENHIVLSGSFLHICTTNYQIMKLLRAIIVLLLASTFVANAQIKNYTLINYGPKNYGQNYDAENIAIAQNEQGIMYFGTAKAIFEYDGSFWKRINIRDGVWVYSILPTASSDTIFVGGNNEFGYLLALDDGNYNYVSLSDSISDFIRFFSDVREIFKIGNKVYFQCFDYVFVYTDGEITIIEPNTVFHTSFCVNGKIYTRQREIGLTYIDGDSVKTVPGGQVFGNIGIFGMVPIDDGKCMIITYEDGSWIMDDNGIEPNTSDFDNTIAEIGFKITSCTSLNDSTLVLGSYDNGLLVIRLDGTVVSHKNANNGLIDNSVISIFSDREHNVWITTNKGITLLPNNDVLSVFSSESGLNGRVNSVIEYKDRLYVGTSTGLYVQNVNRNNYTENLFVQIGDFKNDVWGLAQCSGALFVGTSNGLYRFISGNKFEKVCNTDVHYLSVSQDEKYMFIGGQQGLSIIEYNDFTGNWLTTFSGIGGFSISGLESVMDSSGNYVIWLGAERFGFTQVRFDGFEYTMNRLFNNPAKPVKLFGKMSFINNYYIFSFEDDKMNEIINGTSKEYEDGIYSFGNMSNVFLVKSDDSIAWISQGTNLTYYHQGDSTLYYKKFLGLDEGKINCIYTTDNKRVWLGTANGLVLCDNTSDVKQVPLYGLNRAIETDAPNVFIRKENSRIDYKYNTLSFYYSAPWFQCPGKVEYSYLLEGWTKEWSKWTSSNKADFSNLSEGYYTFKLKARNVFGDESSVAEYSFTIRPPWYRTTLAYFIYVALILLMIYSGVKYYTYQLKERNRLLDLEVKRQTKQIKEQLETIKAQKDSLTDSINYAARIQQLSLPNTQCIEKYVSESFILFRPRDIVSGDFYWCSEADEKLIITAVDCTGHGVPGALMSMLGMNSLNSIVKVEGNTEPGIIIDELRASIIRSFADKGDKAARDGMDLCLLCIDTKNGKLQFAGAHNPLIQIRNGELTEYKVDKMPCAFGEAQQNKTPFATTTIDIQKGDCFYFFSDGYSDQFGGKGGREKFKKARFRKHLLEIWQLPMQEQAERLNTIHLEFKGDTEQVDDILVIGIRV